MPLDHLNRHQTIQIAHSSFDGSYRLSCPCGVVTEFATPSRYSDDWNTRYPTRMIETEADRDFVRHLNEILSAEDSTKAERIMASGMLRQLEERGGSC